MKENELEEKIKELEKRIEELEKRPYVQITYPNYPYQQWPQPIYPQYPLWNPNWPYQTWCGGI